MKILMWNVIAILVWIGLLGSAQITLRFSDDSVFVLPGWSVK
jgi:hypothetical protein